MMRRPSARLHDSPRVDIYHDEAARCRHFYVDKQWVATLYDDEAFTKSIRDKVDVVIHGALQADPPEKRLT